MSIEPAGAIAETVINTDVAIIGGGPAGLSLAARLSRDCVVIESGGLQTDRRTHHLYHSIKTGEPTKIDALRVRGIGGATLRWTGRCAPLDPYDFEDRPWISETSWPIAYEEALKWSGDAARLMELPKTGNEQGNTQAAEQLRNDGRFVPAQWRFAENKQTGVLRFGDHLKGAFQGTHRRILYEAHAVEILGNGREVKAVRIADRDGRQILVKARHFVLASGCVEICRMMLAAQRSNPEMLGGVSEWLGRGFGQHLRLDAGEITANTHQLARLQRAFGIQRKRGLAVCETGAALNPEFARKNKLGNASIVLRYHPVRGLSPLDWWPSAKARLNGREVHHRNARVFVEVDSEQTVERQSHIGLAEELDPHAMPRAKVHWTISKTDIQTAHQTMEAFAGFVDRFNLGQMIKAEGIQPRSIDLSCRRDSLHQLGGTRMSDSARDGVVDANLGVHGVPNLSVVGGSVFATGGHANPTQTIVALALRLAEHLNARAAGDAN